MSVEWRLTAGGRSSDSWKRKKERKMKLRKKGKGTRHWSVRLKTCAVVPKTKEKGKKEDQF